MRFGSAAGAASASTSTSISNSNANSGSGPAGFAAYSGAWAALALAALFPVSLMIFNPTLMFERGWEQYAGTSAYFVALALLARELWRLRAAEREFRAIAAPPPSGAPLDPAFDSAPSGGALARRARWLGAVRDASVERLIELNREASALDQERAAGRFAAPRYILYLLPVIGFIGTVEGISKALFHISAVLPEVNNLQVFLSKLTNVTSALQIAFDSTLLALFLSAALMFVLTLVHRRAEDFLGRADGWIVEELVPRLGAAAESRGDSERELLRAAILHLRDAFEHQADHTRRALASLGAGLGPEVHRLAAALDRLAPGVERLERAAALLEASSPAVPLARLADAANRLEERLAASHENARRGFENLARGVLEVRDEARGLSATLRDTLEQSGRSARDQMARSLDRLKDALDLLHVSMEQGNALYRSIVRRMVDDVETQRRRADGGEPPVPADADAAA